VCLSESTAKENQEQVSQASKAKLRTAGWDFGEAALGEWGHQSTRYFGSDF